MSAHTLRSFDTQSPTCTLSLSLSVAFRCLCVACYSTLGHRSTVKCITLLSMRLDRVELRPLVSVSPSSLLRSIKNTLRCCCLALGYVHCRLTIYYSLVHAAHTCTHTSVAWGAHQCSHPRVTEGFPQRDSEQILVFCKHHASPMVMHTCRHAHTHTQEAQAGVVESNEDVLVLHVEEECECEKSKKNALVSGVCAGK